MTTFTETAAIRETSVEIMEAILQVADGNEAHAEQIWEGGPTAAELVAIVEIVTNNGMYEIADFHWGDFWDRADDTWAKL